MQGKNTRFRLFLRERLRHRVDRYGCGTLCSNRAFAEIRPCLHDRQKNISYYWGMLGISISIYRFETRLAERRHSVVKTHIFDIIYILLFVVLPTVLLLTAHFHILLIARKLSLQMRALMKQVRFKITANSLKIKEIRNVGLKASTVRLVSVLVTSYCLLWNTIIRLALPHLQNLFCVQTHTSDI